MLDNDSHPDLTANPAKTASPVQTVHTVSKDDEGQAYDFEVELPRQGLVVELTDDDDSASQTSLGSSYVDQNSLCSRPVDENRNFIAKKEGKTIIN